MNVLSGLLGFRTMPVGKQEFGFFQDDARSAVRPFFIMTDSGAQIAIRHSENIAFDPENETGNCYTVADGVLHTIPWRKITSLAEPDRGQPLPDPSISY